MRPRAYAQQRPPFWAVLFNDCDADLVAMAIGRDHSNPVDCGVWQVRHLVSHRIDFVREMERLCGGRDVEEWREEGVEDDWEEVRSFSSSLCGWTSMGVL